MKIIFREDVPIEPVAKKMRHASTILPLEDGRVLCAWFAGSYEAEPDVDIFMSIRDPAGNWSEPGKVSSEDGIAHWNPVLARRTDGSILLFYKIGFEIATWRTMARLSRDGGRTWGVAREIVPGDEGGRGPVRNKILAARNGTWIAGASHEKGHSWTAFADFSKDEGETWERSNDIVVDFSGGGWAERSDENTATKRAHAIAVTPQSFKGRGVIQPSLWQSRDGNVHMLLRSTEGLAYCSDSMDGGRTWMPPRPTSVPNNNSGLDLVSLDDGTLVLAHNPVAGNWAIRSPLALSVSRDDGITWDLALSIEEGPGEFSYPAIVKTGSILLISWTRNRTRIGFAGIALG